METIKFSVVTVSLNQGEFIRDNIESVLAQNYRNFEHIIVDGGSTDDTLDVLKSFPHLKWTSEPDNGQGDALNKGFARATGDVIVWLNSDDYLAADIFSELAPLMQQHRVVLGAAAQTDRRGNVTDTVANVERSWFDLLKYWVPYAWLAQPAVFFQRSLLEEVRLGRGKYFDEDLFFCMDYDLWMRMAEQDLFVKKLDRICSYFRVYEENKTGRDGEATQRECSRVYRRYTTLALVPERRFAVILPVSDFGSEDFSRTLQNLAAQTFRDLEIILVNQSTVSEKDFREQSKELDAVMPDFCVRAVTQYVPGLLEAYNQGADFCRARYLVFLQPGDVINTDFCREAENIFAVDAIGVALPLEGKPDLRKRLAAGGSPNFLASPMAVFDSQFFSPKFAIKKIAFLDLVGFRKTSSPLLGVPDLLLRAVCRSWGVNIGNGLMLEDGNSWEAERELFGLLQLYIVAQILADYTDDCEQDSFAQLKQEKGVGIFFPKELIQNSRAVLEKTAPDWTNFDYLDDAARLQELAAAYPAFAPLWYLLGKQYQQQGNAAAAGECDQKFRALVP